MTGYFSAYKCLSSKEICRYSNKQLKEIYETLWEKEKQNIRIALITVGMLATITIIFIITTWLWTKVNLLYIIWLSGSIFSVNIVLQEIMLHRNLVKIENEIDSRN